jgi:hypothetical protein
MKTDREWLEHLVRGAATSPAVLTCTWCGSRTAHVDEDGDPACPSGEGCLAGAVAAQARAARRRT